jgi:hypothetical protein
MRKFPILVTLLTTMIASTLTSILASNSFLPIEGYSYNESNPPINFSVEPGLTEYREGEQIDYLGWTFTLEYQDASIDYLTYDSPWLSFSISEESGLLYTNTEVIITFEDPSNSIMLFDVEILTVLRDVTNFSFEGGTTNFIHNLSIDYSDWIFELTYYYGDTDQLDATNPYLSFSILNGDFVYDTDSQITVIYDNFSEQIYETLFVDIFVEPIVTDIYITPPGLNPVDGDLVDYTDWYFEVEFSNGLTEEIEYEDLTEIYPTPGSTWSLSDSEVLVRYEDDRTNVNVSSSYDGLYVEEMAPFYSIGMITLPNINTYFVGDTLDFTGFEVEVIEENYGDDTTTLYSGDPGVFFYYLSEFGSVEVYDGYELTDYEFLNLSEIHFEIIYEDFYYDTFFDVGTPIPITIYPEPTYQLNFKNLVDQDVSVLTDSRQAEIVGDTTWLIKADQPTSLQAVEAVDSPGPGLVIGDALEADFATDISFLSRSLWGVGGAADGYPIIESIYLKAYSVNVNTQVEFFINGESVGFNSLNTEAGDDWIVFTIDQTTLRVGHLEMRLLQAAGDTPITLEELNIVSSEYPTIDLLDMLSFASTVESLDTCADQSGFLTTEVYDEYEYYLETFGDIFTDLKLLDLSTPESNRDELRVTLGDKWAMMDSLHGDDGVPSPSREFNQPANKTNTFWLGFSLILILFTFFWKKRTSDILR